MTSSFRHTLCIAATVQLYDDANGVFGDLISPEVVLSSLAYDENVGDLGNPGAAQAVTSLHSISYKGNQLCIEIDNICSTQKVRVRWMDEEGRNPSTHVWTIDPSSSFIQYTTPGHLFLFSVTVGEMELVLGAYRPVRPLPSGSPHCILIQQQQDVADAFLLEVLLADTEDSLMVAASALDPAVFADKKTVPMLHTIVTNLTQQPGEEKYHKLRLSNRTIQDHICSSWGAMHLLHLLGFQLTEVAVEESKGSLEADAEEYLVFPTKPTEAQLATFLSAKEMLELLKNRADPHFIAELASPPPWQTPLISTVGALASHWNSRGTHFITPDERWQRTERFGARGGGRPRKPAPGNAPSSRGNWGR